MADYLKHFGLTIEPFSQAPSEDLFFSSVSRQQILKRLVHVVTAGQGLGLLIGEVGYGKSALARRLLDNLPENEFEAVLLVMVHSDITPFWLLRHLAKRFHVKDIATDQFTLLSQIFERLVEIHQTGRRVVVIIDEAQMLKTREMMEELRGLLNLEVPGSKLVHFILVGLPELDQHVLQDLALAQRIAMRCYLKPLSVEETKSYVEHRLSLAGAKKEIFLPEAIAEIQHFAGGIPRVINSLGDNALLEAFLSGEKTVNAAMVQQGAENLRLTKTMY